MQRWIVAGTSQVKLPLDKPRYQGLIAGSSTALLFIHMYIKSPPSQSIALVSTQFLTESTGEGWLMGAVDKVPQYKIK